MKINRIKLITLMAEKNLTVNGLSAKTGLTRGTLSAIRTGKSCYARSAKLIADALEIPVAELIEEVSA